MVSSRRQTRKHRKGTRRKMRGGFRVQFASRDAVGNLRPRSETLEQPVVQWNSGNGSGLYTVLMWDPDAPAASWIHFLVVNIPGSNILDGETILSYTPPSPPSGTHRYYVSLYKQPGRISVSAPPQRGNFDVAGFVETHGLTKIGESMIRVAADEM